MKAASMNWTAKQLTSITQNSKAPWHKGAFGCWCALAENKLRPALRSGCNTFS
jgi:hypothetical protein